MIQYIVSGRGHARRLLCATALYLGAAVPQGHAGSVTYTYDTRGRLSSAGYSNCQYVNYEFDAPGNRNTYAGENPPVAVTDPVTMSLAAGQSTTFNPAANDTDPDNIGSTPRDTLYVSALKTQPSKGSASLNATTHKVTYTAQAGVTGTYSFTYTLNDSQGCTATGTVQVTVNN